MFTCGEFQELGSAAVGVNAWASHRQGKYLRLTLHAEPEEGFSQGRSRDSQLIIKERSRHAQ